MSSCVHDPFVVQGLVRPEDGSKRQNAPPRGEVISDWGQAGAKDPISDVRGECPALRSVGADKYRHLNGVPIKQLDDGTLPDGFLAQQQAQYDPDIVTDVR